MQRFKNKVCLIVTSKQAANFTIAERMAAEGGNVIICPQFKQDDMDIMISKMEQNLSKTGSSGTIDCLKYNLRDADERQQLLQLICKRYGRIDVLVLNAYVEGQLVDQLQMMKKKFDQIKNEEMLTTLFMVHEAV